MKNREKMKRKMKMLKGTHFRYLRFRFVFPFAILIERNSIEFYRPSLKLQFHFMWWCWCWLFVEEE